MISASFRNWLLSDVPDSRFQARMGRFYLGWLTFARNPLAMLGLFILILLIVMAIFAPWIAPHNPLWGDLPDRLLPPSGKFLLGTDDQGRDIFSRIVFGARTTLYIIGLVAVTAAPIGLLIGTTAGYLGGWVETALMRLVETSGGDFQESCNSLAAI